MLLAFFRQKTLQTFFFRFKKSAFEPLEDEVDRRVMGNKIKVRVRISFRSYFAYYTYFLLQAAGFFLFLYSKK
jgi:hypothetical protein